MNCWSCRFSESLQSNRGSCPTLGCSPELDGETPNVEDTLHFYVTKNNQAGTEMTTSLCTSFQSVRNSCQAVGTGGVGGESRIPMWRGMVRPWVEQ